MQSRAQRKSCECRRLQPPASPGRPSRRPPRSHHLPLQLTRSRQRGVQRLARRWRRPSRRGRARWSSERLPRRGHVAQKCCLPGGPAAAYGAFVCVCACALASMVFQQDYGMARARVGARSGRRYLDFGRGPPPPRRRRRSLSCQFAAKSQPRRRRRHPADPPECPPATQSFQQGAYYSVRPHYSLIALVAHPHASLPPLPSKQSQPARGRRHRGCRRRARPDRGSLPAGHSQSGVPGVRLFG